MTSLDTSSHPPQYVAPTSLLEQLAAIHHIQIQPPRTPPAGWWIDRNGRAVAIDAIPPYDQLREETLRPLVETALALYLDLADLKARLFDDIQALIDTCADQYDVKLGGQRKGNITLYLYDGSFRVERKYQDRTRFNERIAAAEALVREFLDAVAERVEPEIRQLIAGAFDRNARGDLRRSELIRLRGLNITDERWRRAMAIVAEAEEIIAAACYVTVSVRDAGGKYHPLPLDLAAIRPHKRAPAAGRS